MRNDQPSLPLRLVKGYLDLVRILVWIAAVFVLIGVLYALLRGDRGDHPPEVDALLKLELPAEALQGPGFGLPADHPRLKDGFVTVGFGTADKLVWIAQGGVTLFILGVIWYGVRQLRQLMRDVLDRRPFTRDNARRLRRVGLLALGWQIVTPWWQYVWGRFVLARFDLATDALAAPLGYDLEPIILALAVLALAEIFGAAARLQEETDLTV